ncbi:MAG: type IV secretion system protein [Treponema sp.]|nr:type IV secretion system protein [Treponema sp.]
MKFVVVVSCLAFFLSIGITVFAINRPDSIPVLVTMNDFGETRYIGEVSRKNWQNFQVPEVSVSYDIREFVECIHSLSTDRAVVRRNVEKAYHLLTSTTASKLSTLLKESRPYEEFGTRTREVEFETEPMKISKDTYQLDYKVVTRSLSGQIENTVRYRAVITVATLDPVQEDIKDNPLGIYITNFDIKELY